MNKRIHQAIAVLLMLLFVECVGISQSYQAVRRGYVLIPLQGLATIVPHNMTDEEIAEEIRLGEMELVALVVHAEAGNQDLKGKRLVADVIYNRVKSPRFPNTVEGVIYQKGQFGVMTNGAFEKAGYHITEEDFMAAAMEYYDQMDEGVLFFNTVHQNGRRPFQHGNHWFSY